MAAPPALYACDPDRSRGRLYQEPPSKTRSPFRRDCDRVIHSTAFRRLKHKTQVFVFHEGDHYRTRLTHSLEVAQIARALARQLGLDEDLTETLALAHDLGHPPFGHAGERALDACLKVHGGFDHNAQTLRVIPSLEPHSPAFDGLNLTWESLEGIVKHNGPLTDRAGTPIGKYAEHGGVPIGIADFVKTWDLELWSCASLEAQVAAIADDIAYDAHDIDDGLRAGMFSIEDLGQVPLLRDILTEIAEHHPRLETARQVHELVRRLITRMIAIVPAAIVAIFYGESGTAQLLILSQVILSLQLSFAVFPLIAFTSDRVKMGEFANPLWLKAIAWLVAFVIAALNAWLLVQTIRGWVA